MYPNSDTVTHSHRFSMESLLHLERTLEIDILRCNSERFATLQNINFHLKFSVDGNLRAFDRTLFRRFCLALPFAFLSENRWNCESQRLKYIPFPNLGMIILIMFGWLPSSSSLSSSFLERFPAGKILFRYPTEDFRRGKRSAKLCSLLQAHCLMSG